MGEPKPSLARIRFGSVPRIATFYGGGARGELPVRALRLVREWADGLVRVIDLSEFLRGPVFDEIRSDPAKFREIRVDSELGTVVWPNGADVDPDVLYGSHEPAWRSDAKTS